MKIAYIGHKRVPSREGGIEKTVEKQAYELAARGHRIVLYNRSGHNIFGSEYDRPPVLSEGQEVSGKGAGGSISSSVIYTPRGWAGVPVYSFLATLRAVRDHCDILFYHGSGSCLMIPLARLLGAKCAAMLHGIDSRRAKWKRFGRMYLRMGEKAAAKKADVCFVLSDNMQKYIRETYGTETVCIWNGTERPESGTGSAESAAAGKSGILERFGLEKESFLLTLVRIVPEKGLHYLIRAFRQCRTEKKLVIVGGVDPACREYYKSLCSLAEGDPRILFTGYLEDPVVTEMYLSSYAFVLPSDLEGMAHSLLEAMAAGCCCLVSDIPENREVIRDHGLVFRRGDVQDLQDKLQSLLDDPAAAAEFRSRVAEYALRTYSWESCADRIESVFRDIVKTEGISD